MGKALKKFEKASVRASRKQEYMFNLDDLAQSLSQVKYEALPDDITRSNASLLGN